MNSIIIFRRLAGFRSDDWRNSVPTIGEILFRCLAESVRMIGKRGVRSACHQVIKGKIFSAL